MKYKIGDKVQIKSIDWYNKYKDEDGVVLDEDGVVLCGEFVFLEGMKKFCSEIFTISEVFDDCYSVKEDNNEYYWTDEMIEGLVERNGKTYPYKIGDRVVLKGNNRCATITDLKYNSWGNLSYYIKIDNDKDISIDYPTDLLLPYDNKIKGFLEEETKPKFKVGDKITNGEITFTILTLSSDRYDTEDTFGECGSVYFKSQDEWKIVEKEVGLVDNLSSRWVNEFNLPDGYIFKDENGNEIHATKIILEKANTLKIQSDNMEIETHRGYYTTEEDTTNKSKKVAWFSFGDNDFADKVELDLSNRELIQEDGKWFVVKKEKEYPKTYEECYQITGLSKTSDIYGYKNGLLFEFQKLLIARDAYWQIAGDEMGLGKPWEPSKDKMVYSIYRHSNEIETDFFSGESVTFEFPTEKMRDDFKKNFDKDIEFCKELL